MRLPRRSFIKSLISSAFVVLFGSGNASGVVALSSKRQRSVPTLQTLPQGPVSTSDLGPSWEGLNPGYWQVVGGHLRRALVAVGDRARNTGFPFHYESEINPDGKILRDYDPSLPMSILWNRDWKLSGKYTLYMKVRVKGASAIQREGDNPAWAMYGKDYGLFGLVFGGNTQFESFYPSPGASPSLLVKENGACGLFRYTQSEPQPIAQDSTDRLPDMSVGDQLDMTVQVDGGNIQATIFHNGISRKTFSVNLSIRDTEGWFGIASRGLFDVEIEDISVEPGSNKRLHAPLNECHVCYPLGDSLRKTEAGWQVRFVGIFRSYGKEVTIRIADRADPVGGWGSVANAGRAPIVNNEFRSNTAIIDAILPDNPAEKTQYYTVWKDGVNVTADPRPGTDSVGPGTGLVGDVPRNGSYTGRLPRLAAPYKICGLSCHAIHTARESELKQSGNSGRCGPSITAEKVGACQIYQPFYVHDQPCYDAFRYIEDFNYQIMMWEDDVWYMELLLYPPSTEDAYKIVTTSIAGPTTRWQMMRHWNVLNPGDHDHGMDDVKGPEQILIRNRHDLGQDKNYMVRNFQIVSHLMTGKKNPSGKDNPKRWRKWKMPNRDFTLMVMDSRLWRTSQDTAIWDDEGWEHDTELYTRTDPTRALLGEEQFAWLTQELKTDSSPLICLTGINALHTIWGGHRGNEWANEIFDRDRVSADYAGWVKAGADRILDVISARSGVVSIYGDVHAGSILCNREKRIYECSFGPIGRWGGRSLIDGFAGRMKDYDGRDLDMISLYHHAFRNANLEPQETINYWNVLEAEFDPTQADAKISLTIRNITDPANAAPRGGGSIKVTASETGVPPVAYLPPLNMLENADILFLNRDYDPVRGARSLPDGSVPITGLNGVEPGEEIIVIATRGSRSESKIIKTGTASTNKGTKH